MIRANFFDANSASCSLRAPVHTTLPDLKISAVVLGSRIRMTTPLKRAGLYSVLRVRKLIVRRLSSHPKSIVATQFLKQPMSHYFQYRIHSTYWSVTLVWGSLVPPGVKTVMLDADLLACKKLVVISFRNGSKTLYMGLCHIPFRNCVSGR